MSQGRSSGTVTVIYVTRKVIWDCKGHLCDQKGHLGLGIKVTSGIGKVIYVNRKDIWDCKGHLCHQEGHLGL